MQRRENNYAFIDGQNLYLGIKQLGWKLDYRKFRRYLREKHGIKKAYLFIGYIRGNEPLYQNLERSDFVLVFKPVTAWHSGTIKGNVDADLVVRAMAELDHYYKAVILSGDGDFYSLVGYLKSLGKLEVVLAPNAHNCSWLLRDIAGDKIRFISTLKPKLSYGK